MRYKEHLNTFQVPQKPEVVEDSVGKLASSALEK